MFKTLINGIKINRTLKLLGELCDGSSCENCKSFLGADLPSGKPPCAHCHVIEQMKQKWMPKEGYCPICDKIFTTYSDSSSCDCPTCGHHISLHGIDDENAED